MKKDPRKLPFTQLMVSIMPKKQGVYIFWNQSGEVIYIGTADKPNNLYIELKRHFDNVHSISIDGIYDFEVEICNNPGKQQTELLETFKKKHGNFPDYNEKLSLPKS